jgi:hypothetical protein
LNPKDRRLNPLLKLVLDLGPLLLFFLANSRPALFLPLVSPILGPVPAPSWQPLAISRVGSCPIPAVRDTRRDRQTWVDCPTFANPVANG